MRYKITIIFLFFGIASLGWLIWYFFFNIYEVKFVVVPLKNTYFAGEEVLVKAEPVNSFGRVIQTRTASVEVEVLNDETSVQIEKQSDDVIKLSFEVKGEAKIRISSPLALRPTEIEFSVINKK